MILPVCKGQLSDYNYGVKIDNEHDESRLIKNCTAHQESMDYRVVSGPHTYKMTLYVYINQNKLILDTLTFSSDSTMESITSAEDFVKKIKANNLNKYLNFNIQKYN